MFLSIPLFFSSKYMFTFAYGATNTRHVHLPWIILLLICCNSDVSGRNAKVMDGLYDLHEHWTSLLGGSQIKIYLKIAQVTKRSPLVFHCLVVCLGQVKEALCSNGNGTHPFYRCAHVCLSGSLHGFRVSSSSCLLFPSSFVCSLGLLSIILFGGFIFFLSIMKIPKRPFYYKTVAGLRAYAANSNIFVHCVNSLFIPAHSGMYLTIVSPFLPYRQRQTLFYCNHCSYVRKLSCCKDETFTLAWASNPWPCDIVQCSNQLSYIKPELGADHLWVIIYP